MAALKGQSIAMNHELTAQNEMLTHLDDHMTRTSTRIERNTRHINAL